MPSLGEVLDSGVVTGSTATSITDSSKSWVINALLNQVVYFPRTGVSVTITSNTLTALVFQPAYSPTVGEAYAIRAGATIVANTATTLASQQSQLTSQQTQLTSQQTQLTAQQGQLTAQQTQLTTQQAQLTSQQTQLNAITSGSLQILNAIGVPVTVTVSIP